MQVEIDIGGRLRLVRLSRSGDQFTVTVDGRNVEMSAVRIDDRTLSLIFPDGASYEVIVGNPGESGERAIQIGGIEVGVSIKDGRRARRRDDAAQGSGSLRITAPMPGKIVRLLVRAGDRVAARQPVIVMEAMKMENELRATVDGTVAELHVQEGASVDAGVLLATIVAGES